VVNKRWLFIHPFQLRLLRGIETYLWNLSSALVHSGIGVDILTWDGSLSIPEYVQHPEIRIHRVPNYRYFQAAAAIPLYLRHIMTGNYSHVFTHFAGYGEGFSLFLAGFLRQVEFSVVFHFPPSLVPHRYREFARWGFLRDAKHLIAVSQATAREVVPWAGRSCSVIGHGVNVQHFKPDAESRSRIRQQLGIHPDALVLISVAALEERKGIQWGIKALYRLLTDVQNLHYVVVGDGAYRKPLEILVDDLGVADNVHFLGTKLDVSPYLCAADIVLVLSKGEASSISLLEAMACQLPSITSICPPFDELVNPAWGIKVEEENISAIVQALTGLIGQPDIRLKMGLEARSCVIESRQWQQVAQQYRDLIG
jgi:glycosyltransferase involved in cell wall biosynthesis